MIFEDSTEAREALQSEHNVSRETLARLDTYLACLDDWRGRVNLIGPAEWAHIWSRHIADSLALLPYIPANSKILDIGSGGGFPALPLACALFDQAGFYITLVESTGKKAAFLRAAIAETGVKAKVLACRIESLTAKDIGPVDIITARAVAPLPKLLAYAEPALARGAVGLFHKGRSWREEVEKARQEWHFQLDIFPQPGDEGAVLKLSEVSHVGRQT